LLAVVAGTAHAQPSLQEIDNAIVTQNYDLAVELIDLQLAATPEDVSLLFRRARVQGYLGNYGAALETLDDLRLAHPRDVDYALARAQILVRLYRDAEALEELRKAVLLSPEYEEVWRLQYDVLSRQHGDEARLERDRLARDAAMRFPDARWWRPAREDSVSGWTMVVGAGHEDLSNGLPSWNRQFVELSKEQNSWGRYRFGVARDERFRKSDLTLAVGSDFIISSAWSAGVDIARSEYPDFQPKLSIAAHVGRALQDGWVFNMRYRRRQYAFDVVGTAIGSVEKYVGDYRFAYALGLSRLHGASSFMNHGLTANWYYNDASSIGVSVNTGKEAESIGAGRVLETDVRGLSVNGRRQLSGRFGLQWWLGIHDQGDFYRRHYIGLAVSIRL
jgi:YaiO family outer membrane protein